MNCLYKAILFFFVTSNLFASSANKLFGSIKYLSDSIPKKEKSVFVKFFYSPQNTHKVKNGDSVFFKDNSPDFPSGYKYSDSSEISAYGYEIGILLEIKLSKKWNINTGMCYDKQGYMTNNISIKYTDYPFFNGIAYSSYSNQQLTFDFRFISIPLILNYEIKKQDATFYFGMGAQPEILMHSSIKFSNGESYSSQDSPYTLFYIANIGASCFITKRAALFIEPNLKYEIGNLAVPNRGLTVHLWSLGCRVGIKF